MNIPHILFEGVLDDASFATILEAIKKLVGRRGRLMWVDGTDETADKT